MKAVIALVVSMLLLSLTPGIGAAAPLCFENNGFSINALDDEPGSSSYLVLAMYLPPSNSFAPNINIQIQPFGGTLDDYIALSKQQIDSLNLTVINVTISEDGYAILEYMGDLQGASFRWYARVGMRDGKIYLVTATATQSQWDEVSTKLIECVKSFQLN